MTWLYVHAMSLTFTALHRQTPGAYPYQMYGNQMQPISSAEDSRKHQAVMFCHAFSLVTFPGNPCEPRNVMRLSWELSAGNYTWTKFHHHTRIYCTPPCVSSCPIKPAYSCCQEMENVLFKAVSNKSTLERCHLSPTDYCIMVFRKNSHLPELYPLELCLLELKNKRSFCLLSHCFGWRIRLGCESWKTAGCWNRGTGKGEKGLHPSYKPLLVRAVCQGPSWASWFLKLVAILWSQGQHSSRCLTRVTILDSWKIGVKHSSKNMATK